MCYNKQKRGVRDKDSEANPNSSQDLLRRIIDASFLHINFNTLKMFGGQVNNEYTSNISISKHIRKLTLLTSETLSLNSILCI